MIGARLRAAPALLALGLGFGPGPAALAQTQLPSRGAESAPERLKPLIGAWDLEAVGKSRRCTVTLAAETGQHGRLVRFPATCRRALPILASVTGWEVTRAGQPRLLDAEGREVLAFARLASESGLEARGPDGQAYRLDPKGYVRAAPRPAESAAQAAAQAAQRRTAVDPATAPDQASLPGRYAAMRQLNREACRLELREDGVAALSQGCGDTGLAIFDPAGWRYAAGRLSLVARRGHSVELVFEQGHWRKDPNVGAPLMLRKLP